jgi:hypothetical protein
MTNHALLLVASQTIIILDVVMIILQLLRDSGNDGITQQNVNL